MANITIDEWIKKAEGRLEAVVKTAAQSVATEASRPTGEGGRMRVDTSFLRNSIRGQVGMMPSSGSNSVEIAIAGWDITKPLYIGWTANYAPYREAYDGFIAKELQNWDNHVKAAVREAKARIK